MEDGVSKTGLVVFVVDDDASVRKALRRLIRSAGLAAEAFASAEEFLDCGHVQTGGCLVLDVRMPGITGLDLQARLKAAGSELPIVFITAHEDGDVREQALGAGAVEFLQKPFDDESLLTAIRTALSRRKRTA